jgi:hypothetical protein
MDGLPPRGPDVPSTIRKREGTKQSVTVGVPVIPSGWQEVGYLEDSPVYCLPSPIPPRAF